MANSSADWRPTASLDVIKKRAALLRQIRTFFYAHNVLEVETPALSVAGNTDPAIESFSTEYTGPGEVDQLYLHTSPEFSMKRLLAAGSGAIYQLCKVFRNGEAGRHHHPEFTMLEWYRPEFDHHQLMNEVALLMDDVIGVANLPVRKITYQNAFIEHVGIDPLGTDCQALAQCAAQHGLESVVGMDNANIDVWCDLLMDQVVMPKLGQGRVFIYDYPASQAALSRISNKDSRVAERFELFIDGVEIANGFYELTDAKEQRERFENENKKRQEAGLSILPIDTNLIAALQAGLPDCAGVALGIDRLLMLLMGLDSISMVITASSIE